MSKHAPSLQSIADALGVSKMSVSLALRDHPRIPAATRTRIKSEATKQGYKPNPDVSRFLSAIRKAKPGDNGLPLACITTGDAPELWRQQSPTENAYWIGASERAKLYGYYVEEFWLEEPRMSARRLSDILWNRGINGVIIPPVLRVFSEANREVSLELKWERFCAVTIGDPLTSPELNRVVHDHYTSIVTAMDRLMQLGYRRIGLCLPEHMDLTVNQRWQAGYRVFRANHPLERVEPLIRPTLVAEDVRAWIKDNRIDAVLAAGHHMPRFFRESGINIGVDVGYADLDVYPKSPEYRGVSGIMQNSEMLGMAAVDMIVGGLQRNQLGIPDVPFVTQVRGSWVDGKTTPPIDLLDRKPPRRSR
ncbi:LacI family DNA-binding transcriptional regulator [Synoicihabitans lomoniglobus]|uniref:LacI family DNA-binding transcriptional regulator n=1 Tax=Synoicihabitans lomoniglobus TaxID=2909285 RepID=A0AAF0CMX3_9BACT|nr:LacI family transcriptional regulator [Opitutaceae bacterium LMO-M01]WED63665.1 LacI family DNA-binding transcriptional regulator [Opitutaceae bacterium LMO-M01]